MASQVLPSGAVSTEALVKFGRFAERAAQRVAAIRDEAERVRVLTSVVKGLARFFWFTVEFGLMREKPGAPVAAGHCRVYGSGLLSSYGEIAHCVDAPEMQRAPARWSGWSTSTSRSTTTSRCSS